MFPPTLPTVCQKRGGRRIPPASGAQARSADSPWRRLATATRRAGQTADAAPPGPARRGVILLPPVGPDLGHRFGHLIVEELLLHGRLHSTKREAPPHGEEVSPPGLVNSGSTGAAGAPPPDPKGLLRGPGCAPGTRWQRLPGIAEHAAGDSGKTPGHEAPVSLRETAFTIRDG